MEVGWKTPLVSILFFFFFFKCWFYSQVVLWGYTAWPLKKSLKALVFEDLVEQTFTFTRGAAAETGMHAKVCTSNCLGRGEGLSLSLLLLLLMMVVVVVDCDVPRTETALLDIRGQGGQGVDHHCARPRRSGRLRIRRLRTLLR